MKKYLTEVEKQLRKLRNYPKNYPDVYKTGLSVWWVKTGVQRGINKKGFSFSAKSHPEQKKIWKYIWTKSNILEVKSQPLFYFQARKKDPRLIDDWPYLASLVDGVENWAHSDTLSDIYARLLERHPKKVLPTLKRWNKSTNPWKRRQSVVSLFYYQAHRASYPTSKVVFKMIKPLLKDSHYYVQKGVGWALRETFQVYKLQTQLFIEKHLHQLSSAAFTTAVEKVPVKLKNEWKKKRALYRKALVKTV